MEKIYENCVFLCVHVNFKHKHKNMFPCKFAYFYSPLHHNGKGSIIKRY